jgi:hypothetical protein
MTARPGAAVIVGFSPTGTQTIKVENPPGVSRGVTTVLCWQKFSHERRNAIALTHF